MAGKDTGISVDSGGNITVVGEGIQYAQLLSICGRLNLELQGMTSRVSTLQVVNGMFGQKFKTRKQALKFIEGKVAEWQVAHTDV